MRKSFYLCLALASPSGEMVDTLVSGASASRHVGSSPISGTKKDLKSFADRYLFLTDAGFFVYLRYLH